MPNLTQLSSALLLLAASQGAQAITVQLDYSLDTSGFFTNNPNSKTDLQAAAQFFEQNLTDSLSAITSSGLNHFNINFNNPTTGAATTINDYSVAANTLVVYVGAGASGGALGRGGFGGYSVSGLADFVNQASTRGQGTTSGTGATDFAPWGGTISFSNTASWYFDPNPSTTESFSGNDFYSVALHELGHLFGLGSADSWKNKVSGSSFTGANAKAAKGGNNVPLAADLAHWAEGTQSVYAGSPQEASMDPTLTVGTRKQFTALDTAALQDVGWQVSATAVPLPPAAFLFASAIIGLLRFRRRDGD